MKLKLKKRQHQYLSQNINLRIRPHLNGGFCISFYSFDKDTLDSIQFPACLLIFLPLSANGSSNKVRNLWSLQSWILFQTLWNPPNYQFSFYPHNFLNFAFNYLNISSKTITPFLLYHASTMQTPGKLLQRQGTQPGVKEGLRRSGPRADQKTNPIFKSDIYLSK